MAVYQEKAKERIKQNLPKMRRIAQKAKEDRYSEADTRKLVIDTLVVLGWDRFEDITAEQMKAGGIADYVVKRNGEDLIVIEIKKAGMRLNQSHVDQAKAYAVEQGMEWAVVTNGDSWQVYRIVFTGKHPKTPEAVHIYSMYLLDDTKPATRANLFYLLSEEAFRKDELADYYDKKIALSGDNLSSLMLSNEVLDKIRLSLKKTSNQKLTNLEIAEAIVTRVFDRELVFEDHFRLIKKIERNGKVAKHNNRNESRAEQNRPQ